MDALETGQQRRVPLKLSSGKQTVIEVDCLVLDHRQAFGRSEWLIVPVAGGDTPVWVTEATMLGDNHDTSE